MRDIPEFFEVGVSQRLFGRDAVVGVVSAELVDEVDALARCVRQHLLDAAAFLRRKVETHSSRFAVMSHGL